MPPASDSCYPAPAGYAISLPRAFSTDHLFAANESLATSYAFTSDRFAADARGAGVFANCDSITRGDAIAVCDANTFSNPGASDHINALANSNSVSFRVSDDFACRTDEWLRHAGRRAAPG